MYLNLAGFKRGILWRTLCRYQGVSDRRPRVQVSKYMLPTALGIRRWRLKRPVPGDCALKRRHRLARQIVRPIARFHRDSSHQTVLSDHVIGAALLELRSQERAHCFRRAGNSLPLIDHDVEAFDIQRRVPAWSRSIRTDKRNSNASADRRGVRWPLLSNRFLQRR